MCNDWLCDDDRSYFSVTEFYTELQWIRMLKGVTQIKEESMTSIYDLFTVVGTGNKKIFIEGEEIEIVLFNWFHIFS